jgi:hypothetical protein
VRTPRRARGLVWVLGLWGAGWLTLFAALAAAALRIPGLNPLVQRYYYPLFFGVVLYLLVLTPFLLGFAAYYVWRKELRLLHALLAVAAFLAVSYGVLWLFKPYFFSGYPG